MKIGIYDPYMPILGGAERYVLSIAKCFESEAEVFIYADDKKILNTAKAKFGLAIKNAKVKPWIKERKGRYRDLSQLDYFFYISDGSLFISPAKKNIVIIQTPYHIPKRNLVNLIKLRWWHLTLCYSQFMSEIIKKRLGITAKQLFVPIGEVNTENLAKKENIILSVGRFFPHLHNKKQLEMVGIFGQMIDQGMKNIKLHLVGSVDSGGEEYFNQVSLKARDLPVSIKTNLSNTELKTLYKKSLIYWHGAGYKEDTEKYPEKAEHFGVSTVEAMSFGCIPVVYAAGGQIEIVTNGHDGFTWTKDTQLIKYTKEILNNKLLQEKFSKNSFRSARNYTLDKFCERLHEILEQ